MRGSYSGFIMRLEKFGWCVKLSTLPDRGFGARQGIRAKSEGARKPWNLFLRCFLLTAIVKILFLQRRLSAGLCLHPNLSFI